MDGTLVSTIDKSKHHELKGAVFLYPVKRNNQS